MYSYFQYTIGQLNGLAGHENDLILRLDVSDKHPGSFWFKLIAGLRIHYPDVGKDVLNCLLDNHSIPTANSIKNLLNDLKGQQIHLMLMNKELVSNQPWWQQTQSWLQNEGWMVDEMPNEYDVVHQMDQTEANQPVNLEFDDLSEWMKTTGEWLEGLRWCLQQKEFEKAGDILEQNAELWLQDGFDPLELLYWLREIPSVLLNARPVLCWLGVKACHALQLPFLVNYYSHAAEHSLNSLSRLSRNPDEWLNIEINENGVTVGALLQKINLLKSQQ